MFYRSGEERKNLICFPQIKYIVCYIEPPVRDLREIDKKWNVLMRITGYNYFHILFRWKYRKFSTDIGANVRNWLKFAKKQKGSKLP